MSTLENTASASRSYTADSMTHSSHKPREREIELTKKHESVELWQHASVLTPDCPCNPIVSHEGIEQRLLCSAKRDIRGTGILKGVGENHRLSRCKDAQILGFGCVIPQETSTYRRTGLFSNNHGRYDITHSRGLTLHK